MIADLSHYQGTIDWEKASKHLDFVILRATVGFNKDQKYSEYAENCRKYKIPYGTYHYMKGLSENEIHREVKHFYETASKENPLFYVVDIEEPLVLELGYDNLGSIFIKKLREYGAKKIGLYIAQRLYPKCVKCQEIIDFNWIPRYGKDDGKFNPQYIPTCDYDIHQYTSKGHLEGTDGSVDLNRLSGTKPLEWFIEKEDEKMSYLMTAKELINKSLDIAKNYKTIYMYATYGFQVTDKTIKAKAEQNLNKWYTNSRIKMLNAVANQTPPTWGFDCVNLFKAIFWGWNGDESKERGGSVYGTNGVPDTNANGMFNRCSGKSADFSTIKPGEAVWLEGHIGLYVGDNLVVECTPSWDNGVQITGLLNVKKVEGINNRKWAKHGFLPWIDYEGADNIEIKIYALGERTLKRGIEGEDVKELQLALIGLGYDLGLYGADGEFGSKTEQAVKEFQKKYDLKVDGVFGETSYKKILEISFDNGGEEPELPEPEAVPAPPAINTQNYTVTGDSVYLWNGHPSYGGEKGIIVHKNDILKKAEKGNYVPIIYNGAIKWINSKYIK